MTARPATLAILPIQLRVGDRLSYADGEWEVVGEPSGLYGGKMVEGRGWRVRKITRPRNMAWVAHEKVTVWRKQEG